MKGGNGDYIGNDRRRMRRRMRTIRCVIGDVEETNYHNDVHLLPMSSHSWLLDGYHRVAGGVDDNATTTANSTATRTTHGNKGDRSDARCATSPILAALPVDDCDARMIRRICDLVHVDVELMKWLGFGGVAVKRCVREMRGGN